MDTYNSSKVKHGAAEDFKKVATRKSGWLLAFYNRFSFPRCRLRSDLRGNMAVLAGYLWRRPRNSSETDGDSGWPRQPPRREEDWGWDQSTLRHRVRGWDIYFSGNKSKIAASSHMNLCSHCNTMQYACLKVLRNSLLEAVALVAGFRGSLFPSQYSGQPLKPNEFLLAGRDLNPASEHLQIQRSLNLCFALI